MSFDEFRDGYEIEATPGTSVIDGVGDTAYLFGIISQNSKHPSPKALMRYTATGYNIKEVGAGLMYKAQMSLRGTYYFILQNGICIYLALGDSSTAGDVHTLTPTIDGSPIPSMTINHQWLGEGTDEEFQSMGIKVDSLKLIYDMEEPEFLMVEMNVMAMKSQDGIALTTPPALPATANKLTYENLERKWDTTGTPVNIDGLQYLEISIGNGLTPIYGHTWDAGVYTGMWPFLLTEAKMKKYRITMDMHTNTVERRLWDSLISTDTAITSTFKFVRSANDYILVTAVGPIVGHELITPAKDELMIARVEIEPYSMTVDVKDTIDDARYGD